MSSQASSGATAASAAPVWRFLVDENLPMLLVQQLQAAGYFAEHVRAVGLGTHPDPDVWAYAQVHQETLITHDEDFADIRHYPPPHAGIVMVDVPNRLTVATRVKIILDGLAQLTGRSLENAIVTIAPAQVRVRRAP
ncbi:MAG TPA: DUF5615 family PIN-like protein [Ktedonobacterales bacterium]